MNEPLADFSPDRVHRYQLWRRWAPDGGRVAFICLNPSTADETTDDPTVRRCIQFAKDWGFSAFCMLNLFAFRSTDPKAMLAHPDPIGPDNKRTILKVANSVHRVVAAWGNHGHHLGQHAWALETVPNLYCLRQNKDGSPCHPLYLPASLLPYPMP
jgi:hypothetical protein